MHQVKRSTGRIASILALAAMLPAAVFAQTQETWPDRAVRLIVPFPPGGQTNNVSRHLATRIAPVLGQESISSRVLLGK